MDTPTNSFASVYTLLSIVLVMLFPVFTFYLIYKNKGKLNEPQTENKFGALYEDFND